MRISPEKLYFVIKLTLTILFVAVFVFLITQKLVLGNELIYVEKFEPNNQFIQGLYPVGRIVEKQNSGEVVQQILGEPVYFRIYAPRHFKKAQVTLTFRKPIELEAKLGVKLNVNDYAFYFENFNNGTSNWQTQTFEFDLASALYIQNKLQFIISAPGVTEQSNFEISQAEFKLIK